YNSLDRRMAGEKSFALSQGHRVGRNLGDAFKRRARNSDQVMHDRNDDFALNVQSARDQKIVGTMNRSAQAVLNRRENIICSPILDARVQRLKRGPRDELDTFAKELDGLFFAECAALALK